MPEEKQMLDKPVISTIVQWATGQPFNNVLLLAIFIAIGYIGYYSMTVAIPAHLKQIQDGYEKLESSHSSERTRTIEVYDRWLDRKTSTTTTLNP